MKMKTEKFILSKVSKTYKKMHNIISIEEVLEHSIIVKSDIFKKGDIRLDKIEVLNIKRDFRDYKLSKLV